LSSDWSSDVCSSDLNTVPHPVFVVDVPKMLPYNCPQQHTVLKIAYKRCWFYVRDTEFLPEVEISSEMKIQAKEDGSDRGDQIEC
jgi:hypothetical protein